MLEIPQWINDLPTHPKGETREARRIVSYNIKTKMHQHYRWPLKQKAIGLAKPEEFRPEIRITEKGEPHHDVSTHEFAGTMILNKPYGLTRRCLWRHIHEPDSWDILKGVDPEPRQALADTLVHGFVTIKRREIDSALDASIEHDLAKIMHSIADIISDPCQLDEDAILEFLRGGTIAKIQRLISTALSEGLFGDNLRDLHKKISGERDPKTGLDQMPGRGWPDTFH